MGISVIEKLYHLYYTDWIPEQLPIKENRRGQHEQFRA